MEEKKTVLICNFIQIVTKSSTNKKLLKVAILKNLVTKSSTNQKHVTFHSKGSFMQTTHLCV